MASFPEDTYLLDAIIPPIELGGLHDALVKVDEFDHLDRTWDRLRRVKGRVPTPPGSVDTHIHLDFVDPDVERAAYNLSHDVPVTLVRSANGGGIQFAPGIYVLATTILPAELVTLGSAAFVPVDQESEAGYLWRKFQLLSRVNVHREQGVDTVTIEFVDSTVPGKSYPAGVPIDVKLSAYPTGKLLAN